MVGKVEESKELPVFIPPRKRTTNCTKKILYYPNHGDFPLNLNKNPKQGTTWDTTPDKTRKWSSDEIIEIENLNANENDDDLNEMQNFQPLRDSSTVTPSSISESSLDGKSSKSHELLTGSGSGKRIGGSKKRVNIRTDLDEVSSGQSPSGICNYEDLESGETSILNASIGQYSLDRYQGKRSNSPDNFLTLTGTIKRGKKKGQSMDVQLNISRDELEKINATAILAIEEAQNKKGHFCTCSCKTGIHIFILSLICLPFITILTSIYSFYIGTITWYNMFTYFNEEKSCWHKIFMTPILILSYPIGIVLCTIGLGIYAGIKQVSCHFPAWINELADIEKGFYGWLCGILHLSDCSPYEVVILTECPVAVEEERQGHSSTSSL